MHHFIVACVVYVCGLVLVIWGMMVCIPGYMTSAWLHWWLYCKKHIVVWYNIIVNLYIICMWIIVCCLRYELDCQIKHPIICVYIVIFLLRLTEYACDSCHACTPLCLSHRNKTNPAALAQPYIHSLSIIACNTVFSLPRSTPSSNPHPRSVHSRSKPSVSHEVGVDHDTPG